MKILLMLFITVIMSCAQTHEYTLEWLPSNDYDISHYNVFLGSSPLLPDSAYITSHVTLAAIVEHDTILISYKFGSTIDGRYVYATVQAVDDSANVSGFLISEPYKKNDEFPPSLTGDLIIRR